MSTETLEHRENSLEDLTDYRGQPLLTKTLSYYEWLLTLTPTVVL